jgi:hypothetical protein
VIEQDGAGGGALELDRRRRLGELISFVGSVYRANAGTLLAISAPIVLVIDLIMGIGLGQVTGHYQAHVSQRVAIVELAVLWLVLAPLLNVTVALWLQERAQGRRPSASAAIQRGLDVFAPTLVAVVLWIVAILAGLVLLFPALYFLFFWYFAPLAVAIEGRRGFGALQRSNELVTAAWLRAVGVLFSAYALTALASIAIGLGAVALAKAANAQVLVLVGDMLLQVAVLPLVGLTAAALFFDLRAARAERPRRP